MPIAEWESVGVTASLPGQLPVIATLRPGDDLQAAIDAAPDTGGILLLSAGDYPLTVTLKLRSNLILKGVDRVRSRLVLLMRSQRPELPVAEATAAWTAGVRLQGVARCGLEELTIIYDATLPPPIPLKTGEAAFKDNPDGRDDLHVVSICLDQVQDCWISGCLILNAGSNPLVVANSKQVTVAEVIIEGAYNRGEGSGELILAHSESVLFKNLRVSETNSFVIQSGSPPIECRYNVISDCRFEIDVRLHGPGTAHNLIQNCAIELPKWIDRTPLSPGNVNARLPPPGPGNLVYFCTITRDSAAAMYGFSMADNPGMIYEVIQTRARVRESSVIDFGPAPPTGFLVKIP
ncbi:MAG: right-handed parallel beta-helix repeat-containing protein [Opitutaceae bacterium]|nr:right-handed parallel beta-helix repeat-containing protein [Opitutaceae bacterium]